YLIYSSIMILALGVLTSTTLLALFHILIAVPSIYFIPKAKYKTFPKSAWVLLGMTAIIVLSVLVTQDIAIKGYKPISKAKYFLFGFLSIAPMAWYFKNHFNEKKISYLLYAFCIATTVASFGGISGIWFGYNPILMKSVFETRNGGLFGMLMNYAHNISYFLIIVTGLVIYRKEAQKYINKNFLYVVFFINLLGLYMTYTRGAWLGYLAGVPFFYFKNNKKWFATAILAILAVGAMAYFGAGEAMKRKDYDATRLGQWQAATFAFKERPFLGYGYLNFEEHSSEIKKKYNLLAPDFRGHAHNNFFEMLGSTGGLGFVAFVLWLGIWFKETLDRSDLMARLSVPFIITFVVGGLTQSTISLGINLFFVMGVYALVSICNVETKDTISQV
ncbi:MAG: O-antigen ligase family protein, partial [Bdellovibrionales bacterium]|nr:O-antigen ligase family protein [Bdellovibrionales bacterium]